MTDYAEQRREKLANILGRVPFEFEECLGGLAAFVEEEVRAAFVRGTRSRGRGTFSPGHSRQGKSAVQAGVLRRVEEAGA